MKDDLHFSKMEDDHHFQKWKLTSFFGTWKTTTIFSKWNMTLTFWQMEDDTPPPRDGAFPNLKELAQPCTTSTFLLYIVQDVGIINEIR